MAKVVYNFGLSVCNRVKIVICPNYSKLKTLLVYKVLNFQTYCTQNTAILQCKKTPYTSFCISLNNDFVNPIALRKAKIVYNFGLSECNRVKHMDPYFQFRYLFIFLLSYVLVFLILVIC